MPGHCAVGDYADENICTRKDSNGNDVIVTSDLNRYEQAIANAILLSEAGDATGALRSLDKMPDNLPFANRTIENAEASLFGGGPSVGQLIGMAAATGIASHPAAIETVIKGGAAGKGGLEGMNAEEG